MGPGENARGGFCRNDPVIEAASAEDLTAATSRAIVERQLDGF